MKRGAKPKTREEHQRNGSYVINPNRENKDRPNPINEAPAKPDVVSEDKIASKKWDQLVEHLTQLGIIATCDTDLMEVYCVLFSQYRSALASVNKTGLVLVTRERNGKQIEVKRNPFETVQNKTIMQMSKMMAELGLTPSARERLAASPGSNVENDPFLEFLAMSKNNNN